MGSWGTGLLENDSSLDYIGNLVQRVIKDLVADLDSLDDGILERDAGACVSILATLVESYYTASAFVTLGNVDDWREKVSTWLAAVASLETDDREDWQSYSGAFEAEFNRLEAAIKNAENI